MSDILFPYRILPLGDGALTIDFGNCIDEAVNVNVINQFNKFLQDPFPGMTEAVPAYSSMTVYYDTFKLRKIVPTSFTVFEWVKTRTEQLLLQPFGNTEVESRLVRIPVCYDIAMGPDLPALCASKELHAHEVIGLHTSKQYRVYMLGFLPGFAYMGQTDERIAMPRKPQPQSITQGSVGIAGRQTGIYPFNSPGGWHIIGKTPVKLFKGTDNTSSTLFRAGDMVEFYAITKDEFDNY